MLAFAKLTTLTGKKFISGPVVGKEQFPVEVKEDDLIIGSRNEELFMALYQLELLLPEDDDPEGPISLPDILIVETEDESIDADLLAAGPISRPPPTLCPAKSLCALTPLWFLLIMASSFSWSLSALSALVP
ncbi:hypothetical protein DM860_014083 [Cuscuta australis]|uniref:Uncharacterized protein n=1 Tax=Cuscuta australis TaxID=267555 RepID=A0A328DES3_9ASTE|nr:hypothetical protein DM860_014083 [Cuscuta australis]